MKVYLVTREGIYNQGHYGIFDNKEKAINAAKEAKSKEPDNYHDFYVNTKNLNEKTYVYLNEEEIE